MAKDIVASGVPL